MISIFILCVSGNFQTAGCNPAFGANPASQINCWLIPPPPEPVDCHNHASSFQTIPPRARAPPALCLLLPSNPSGPWDFLQHWARLSLWPCSCTSIGPSGGLGWLPAGRTQARVRQPAD